MKIGIDIRGYSDDGAYGSFVLAFTKKLIETDTQNTYHIYTENKNHVFEKAEVTVTHYRKNQFFHQKSFKRILESGKLAFVVFFDEHVPKNLSVEYYSFVESLTRLFFPNSGFIEKLFYQKRLSTSLSGAKRVLVFDSSTAYELNERLDVRESAIEKISPFFCKHTPQLGDDTLKGDIKSRHNLKGDYMIYDVGSSEHANFERALETFQKLNKKGINLYLLVLSDGPAQDIGLRQKVLEYQIEGNVFFLGSMKDSDKYLYYTQSRAVIYPSIYASFCFDYITALSYGVPIIANELKSSKEIFADAIHYANFLSPHRAAERIEIFLNSGEQRRDYSELFEDLSSEKTVQDFLAITGIKQVEKDS